MEKERQIGQTGERSEVNRKKNYPGELSQRARKVLEKRGYEIFELKNESLESLRKEGKGFSTSWHEGWKFEKQSSRSYEVAIKPRHPLLSNSNYKSLLEQDKLIKNYSDVISKKIPDVEATIGEISEYAQIILYNIEQRGLDLFGGKLVRSITKTEDNEVASIGYHPPEGFNVISTNRSRRNPIIYASPIIRKVA